MAATKAKSGGGKSSGKTSRQRHLSLKLSPEELAAFRGQADQTGVKLATWARTVMRRAAGLPTP